MDILRPIIVTHALPLRAVVFDLDGLMFNTEELYIEVGGEILRRRGRTFSDELRHQMMGRPSRISLQIMIDHHGLPDTVDGLQHETDEIFRDLLATRLAPMPGLVELLAALEQAKIRKAIATSSRMPFVKKVLAPFQFLPRFEFVLTSEDVQHGKPHPEMYLTAASRLGFAPAQCLVLEDSSIGCQAAVASGAYAVAVPGAHNAGQSYPGAAVVADSLKDHRIYRALGLPAPQ